jgi:hypothetical protein
MDNGQWTVDNGQWTVDSGQWTIVNEIKFVAARFTVSRALPRSRRTS